MNEQRNPYVGPRVFTYDDRGYFFGRHREARDLLARVMSQRLVLFYAQSGAGKSSLINARLIPQLREAGFAVLPVGRVGGELFFSPDEVDNIYLFNLMVSLDQGPGQPDRLARLSLSDFLHSLASEDGLHYAYHPSLEPEVGGSSEPYPAVPYVLIIDQFEELITTYPERWPEREAFFRQLNQAMLADPDLWVVLTLREDYLAALDPFALLMRDRLRARFYMQRLSAAAACRAVTKPAAMAGRPFAPGVAEALVDDLRQVKLQHPDGSTFTELGPYVEPVQLQVVCYRLWENLAPETSEITESDLLVVGDVNQSLADYYANRVAAVHIKCGLGERAIRDWVEKQLITATGMRGQVIMEPEESAGLANEAIRLLQDAHLLRAEKRSGATWFELTHDRLVEPVRQNNAAWRRAKLSLLQRQATLWAEQGRPEGLLLRGAVLEGAESWARDHANYMSPADVEFLDLCLERRERKEQAQAQAQERTEAKARSAARGRRIAIALAALLLIAVIAALIAFNQGVEARAAEVTSEANAKLAATRAAEALEAEADARIGAATARAAATSAAVAEMTSNANAELASTNEAHAAFDAAAATAEHQPALNDMATATAQANALTAMAQANALAATAQANALTATAQANDAATKTPTIAATAAAVSPTSPAPGALRSRSMDRGEMVFVPGGAFTMGDDSADDNPQHQVTLRGFWIDRTEVTYEQFESYVNDTKHVTTAEEDGYGEIYRDGVWRQDSGATWKNPDGTDIEPGTLDRHPVVQVSWVDASNFCSWAGGQLPTEAQWEYAARGQKNNVYPWNGGWDASQLNYCDQECPLPYLDKSHNDGYARTAPVGTYSTAGDSWVGAVDMAGNVWEWVADWYGEDYYQSSDANNDPTGPESGTEKVVRGGGWSTSQRFVYSANRLSVPPTERRSNRGFRCVLVPES